MKKVKYVQEVKHVQKVLNNIIDRKIVKTEFLKKGILEKVEQDFQDIFLLFQEILKNKWVEIPNKNLYFNQEIMACYPNFKNNFQNIRASEGNSYDEVMEMIHENKEYQKYEIPWEIQTGQESTNSFYNKWHPMESDANHHRIQEKCYFVYCKGNTCFVYNNDSGCLERQNTGLVIPIFRLNQKESNTVEHIMLEFIRCHLIPDIIFEEEKQRIKYQNIIAYFNYIDKLEVKKGEDKEIDILSVSWNYQEIEKSLKQTIERELFQGCSLKVEFDNGDWEEIFGSETDGKVNYHFVDGSYEERQYNKGILQDYRKYFYPNGDYEDRMFLEQGNSGIAICHFLNKDYEERNYVNGVLEGDAIYYSGNKKRKYIYVEGKRQNPKLLDEYLLVDKKRINLDAYPENMLFDPNDGHWDLEEASKREELQKVLGMNVYGKNPSLDIRRGGVVGVDFGTKSTVVVYQKDSENTFPMRISGGSFQNEVRDTDYENPTLIEFKNLGKFLKDYQGKIGRPNTKWEDVTVSHTAFENLLNGSNDEYDSIIADLKQWTNSKKKKIHIRDKQGKIYDLPPYIEIQKGDLDPIEIYAYYIGSYINNMTNGIYLEYFLSFPVTYEKQIREKILKSFEQGIKKSLPQSILENKEEMERFRVRHGANEPAAYAVCALQEFGLDPEEEDGKVYYGVFDFGGGTTDFDFGIWSYSEDERNYIYELEHFGAGGDAYLGGENILQELAFEVFKDNQEKLREHKIQFTLPEWKTIFKGHEVLLSTHPEAKLNMRTLSEKLRDFWEGKSELEPVVKLNLYTQNRENKVGFELRVDEKKLKNIVEKKINDGIHKFFISMDKAFRNEEKQKISIFLAGNSCKHPFVTSIFEEYKSKREEEIEIFPPLGSEKAIQFLKEKEIFEERDIIPTGKTGVAYGLLASKSGGKIKIINRDEESNLNQEINFRYYVGYEGRKNYLKPILQPESEYHSVQYLQDSVADVFHIYYTTSPEAGTGKLSVSNPEVKRTRQVLKTAYENGKIYLQAIGVDRIKYMVTEKDIAEKDYLEEGEISLD